MSFKKKRKKSKNLVTEYWFSSRHPFYSLISVFPVLIFYEIIALTLNQHQKIGIRNAADVILKDFFFSLFIDRVGIHGVFAIGTLIIVIFSVYSWRKFQKSDIELVPVFFVIMFIEALFYAILLGPAIVELTKLMENSLPMMLPNDGLSLPHKIMLSFGAGFYEELVFRGLLLSGTTYIMVHVLSFNRKISLFLASLFSSILFSIFHYLGPYGEPYEMYSFIFRTLAGGIFAILYIFRGFGIAVYTHTLYDLLIIIHQY